MRWSQKSREFVRGAFTEYYRRLAALDVPTKIEDREFGFLTFDERSMLRHKSFKSANELKAFLEKTVPSDAYFSSAHYEQPEAEMDKKGWLGADLIFDIDADHIPTSCNKVHDEWICDGCNFVGKGLTPEKCPACGGQKFDVLTWPCEVCLNSAKAETAKLLDMLMRDFGFNENELSVFFSGHRGYHVYVENELIKSAEADARKEIVDYICGLGFDVTFHDLGEKDWKSTSASKNLSADDFGWRGRVMEGMCNFILTAKQEDYKTIGLRNNTISTIMKNKEKILKNLGDAGYWGAIKGVGFETWKRIIDLSVDSQSAKIDTVVTTDVHRLIRLTDSLHGKTGFRKVEFPIANIEEFDPFKNALAFKGGTAAVFVSSSPEFRLGDETFGPYKNRKVELPTSAAILLICKGRAEVVE